MGRKCTSFASFLCGGVNSQREEFASLGTSSVGVDPILEKISCSENQTEILKNCKNGRKVIKQSFPQKLAPCRRH